MFTERTVQGKSTLNSIRFRGGKPLETVRHLASEGTACIGATHRRTLDRSYRTAVTLGFRKGLQRDVHTTLGFS